LGAIFMNPTTDHAISIVHLYEQGGMVHGDLEAKLQGVSFGDGAVTIDELTTFASFQSAGTADSLKWTVSTTASGVELGGTPIFLPEGKAINLPGFSFGIAGPYVDAPKSGDQITIIAPGLWVASNQQSMFFAGAELYANMARAPALPSFAQLLPPLKQPPPTGPVGGPPPATSSTSVGGPVGGPPPNNSAPTSYSSGGNQVSTGPQFGFVSRRDGPWAPVSILALGVIGLVLVLLRWIRQFEWGQDLFDLQPLRSFQWLYRAFLKT
jgi:hypothetical protein